MASSRRFRNAALSGAAAGVAAGVILTIAAWTILPPGVVRLGNQTYYLENEYLFGNRSDLAFTFHGVAFTFHLWCEISVDTGYVCGNATEPGGPTYSYTFSDGLPRLGPAPWQTVISPTGASAVQYQQGGHAALLVATGSP